MTRDCTSRARSPRAPAAVILHPEQRSSATPANDTWKRPSLVVRTRRVLWPKLTVTRSPALKCKPETTSGLLFAITSRGAAADADGTTTAAANAAINARFMPTMYRARGGFKPHLGMRREVLLCQRRQRESLVAQTCVEEVVEPAARCAT